MSRIIYIIIMFFYSLSMLSAGTHSGASFILGIPGLPDLFDFEDNKKGRWSIDPSGTQGVNSWTNIYTSNYMHYDTGNYSLALDVKCSKKAPDGKLGGKIHYPVIDHGSLTGKTKFRLRYYVRKISGGGWGSDWLCIYLYFFRKAGTSYFGEWSGGNWTNPDDPPGWNYVEWDFSGISPRDFISEIGIELRGGQYSYGNVIIYFDKIEMVP